MIGERNSDEITESKEIKKEMRIIFIVTIIFLLIGIWLLSLPLRYGESDIMKDPFMYAFSLFYVFAMAILLLLLWFKGRKRLKINSGGRSIE